ncbi:MAG: asparagine synthase, partial [Cytophaga sp.]|nr:asparagine synthase [Undibacterium sp.]
MLEKTLFTGKPEFDTTLHFPTTDRDPEKTWLQVLKGSPSIGVATVRGSFSVGIVNSTGGGFLAVDRFAIETLCYRIANNQLTFASRADELGDAADIDPQAIFDYLYFHHIPSPRTIYKGVMRLPPGHYAMFENGKLTVAPYWQAAFAPDAGTQFEPAKKEFLSLVEAAVASELDGSRP